MEEQSFDEKVLLLNQMREASQTNQQFLQQTAHTYGYRERRSDSGPGEDDLGINTSAGTFSLRLFVSVVVFLGFLWVHLKEIPIGGYQSEQVVEAVSQNVDLRELADSVKINP